MKRSLCILLLLAAGPGRAAEPGDQIAYWTTTYQGEDLVSGQFACKRPTIPAVSTTRADIAAVQQRLNDWRDCYQRFAANINDLTAAGKRIPSEALAIMTPAEVQQAERHVDAVYAGLAEQARMDAAQVAAEVRAWQDATVSYAENGTDPTHGFLSFLRSTPRQAGQTYLRYANAGLMGTPPAPTGVLR